MTTDEGINYDRGLLGKEFPIGTFEISREMILEFSQASGEVNPIYVDEERARESEYGSIVAPPTFCNLFVNGGEKPDIKLEFGDIGFFAGQAIESLAPIRPGDTVESHLAPKRGVREDGTIRQDGIRRVGDEVRQSAW